MRIGIIQGRLSKPEPSFQDTPLDWQREFDLLDVIGLSHVEWIITKDSFSTNPFLNNRLDGYSINSVCVDNLVDRRVFNRNYFFESIRPVCRRMSTKGVKNMTIPLLEDSSVVDDEKREIIIDYLTEITSEYAHRNLIFSIEAELGPDQLQEIIDVNDNIRITYDTGNMTSFGQDHVEYIERFHEKINNVHLKDRTFDAQTVLPGTGNTNFKEIFSTLKKVGYSGLYTIQTARETTGNEIETITKHRKYFKELYNECA